MQVAINLTKISTLVALVTVLSVTTACGSRGEKEPAAPPEPTLRDAGKTVGTLTIKLSDDMTPEKVTAAQDLDLINNLSAEIKKNVDVGSGSLTVNTVVTRVKLKNNVTAALAGLYAGPDIIAADVTVMENNQVVKTFTSVSTTTRGGNRTGRTARLLRDLGKKIAINI